MNAAHLHLIVNHIPVMGVLFGLIFLLVAMVGRNKTLIWSGCKITRLSRRSMNELVYFYPEGHAGHSAAGHDYHPPG